MASNDSTTYGVNYNSPLNEIDYFHVANMQLPQDVMHILFEGVIPMEIKLLVTRLIQQKFFTIETLNERCKYFMYSRAESKSKPPKDFKEKHFSDPSKKLPLSGNINMVVTHVHNFCCSFTDVELCCLFTFYYWG